MGELFFNKYVGHNDKLLQPTCPFSLAAIFILGEKKKGELELHKKSKFDVPYNS
jgi:hypothetical protein